MFALLKPLRALFLFFLLSVGVLSDVSAEVTVVPPKSGLSVVNFFKSRDSKLFDGNLIEVTNFWKEIKKDDQILPPSESQLEIEKKKIVFVGDEPTVHSAPPGEDVPVRLNKEAPGPFIDMTLAHRSGDKALANAYADQYVRYLVNLMYEVRELTGLIGGALVRQGIIDEESWVGVEQYVDYEFAKSRSELGSPLKPTHDESLKRIVSDTNHEVEVYYFFTLNCKHCREMAPDVERLWRIAKSDPRIKMAGFTLGPQPKTWIESYRNYTGLSMQIFNGAAIAKEFRVAFVPSMVIVTPATKKAYLKTGAQDFSRLYEFLRTAQGLPPVVTSAEEKLINIPIGEIETARASGKGLYWEDGNRGEVGLIPAKARGLTRDSIDKF